MMVENTREETEICNKRFHFSKRVAINNAVSIICEETANLDRHLRDRPVSPPPPICQSYLPRKYILMRVIYQPGRQGQNLKYWISWSAVGPWRPNLADGWPAADCHNNFEAPTSSCLVREPSRWWKNHQTSVLLNVERDIVIEASRFYVKKLTRVFSSRRKDTGQTFRILIHCDAYYTALVIEFLLIIPP